MFFDENEVCNSAPAGHARARTQLPYVHRTLRNIDDICKVNAPRVCAQVRLISPVGRECGGVCLTVRRSVRCRPSRRCDPTLCRRKRSRTTSRPRPHPTPPYLAPPRPTPPRPAPPRHRHDALRALCRIPSCPLHTTSLFSKRPTTRTAFHRRVPRRRAHWGLVRRARSSARTSRASSSSHGKCARSAGSAINYSDATAVMQRWVTDATVGGQCSLR